MRLLRRFGRDQRGFTMVSVMTGMMVIALFTVGAYSAALGDISLGRKDQDRKRALEAAKAGIEWYTYHLLKDSNYWTYCDDATRVATPGISLYGAGRPAAAWRTIPGSSAQFQVELMTADGTSMTQSQCLTNPGTEMLNSGVLRIRSTGRAGGRQRQVVTTFRRTTFLDYLWYTNWESPPPQAYPLGEQTWAAANCDQPRTARRAATGGTCDDVNFLTGDEFRGPMHTEDDSWRICGSPIMGADGDNLEVVRGTSPSTAYWVEPRTGCSNNAQVRGRNVVPARSLELPPSNASLESVATYVTTGKTCLVFNSNNTVSVYRNQTWNGSITCTGTPTNYTLGVDTVFYVKNGTGCTAGYDSEQIYNSNNNCGQAAVRGTYTGNVTIGAADDIIVTGDLVKPGGGDQMMGLIAQNFVRVYHPGRRTSNKSQCDNTLANTRHVQRVEAAILALKGAWTVDNHGCGNLLGDLTVVGNIAQYWRGTVTTGGGYLKDYQYDTRLRYRQPPSYLDPLRAAWHPLRESEQSPVQ